MSSSLQPARELTLTIEKAVAGGRMLARHDGQIVFVAGAIPGERVRARVERISKQVVFAEAKEILTASPDRRRVEIDWACGGSLYAHIEYGRQISLKSELVADAFARIGKMTLDAPVSVMASPEDGYRMRARLHARDGRFGFFREGTHELCDIAPTRQLLPASLLALERIGEALAESGVSGISGCEFVENVPASERAVLVELEASHHAPLNPAPIDGVTGLMFADQFSPRVTVGYGSPYVIDSIDSAGASVSLTHHVQSFFQGNRYALAALVDRVLAQVPDGSVTDLYAGVGLFAVSLAARGRKAIVAVEGDRSSARDLDTNAAAYGRAITVENVSVEGYLRRRHASRPDTLLLDPPRTGISREAMSGILGIKPPRIVYLSCDLATVARDVRRMLESGYALDHIEAFDLFPNTAHVETLVVLSLPRNV